jgi:hypothetical protein
MMRADVVTAARKANGLSDFRGPFCRLIEVIAGSLLLKLSPCRASLRMGAFLRREILLMPLMGLGRQFRLWSERWRVSMIHDRNFLSIHYKETHGGEACKFRVSLSREKALFVTLLREGNCTSRSPFIDLRSETITKF